MGTIKILAGRWPTLMNQASKKAPRPTGYTFMCVAGMIYNIDGILFSINGIINIFSSPLIGVISIVTGLSFVWGFLACFDLLWKKAQGRQKLYWHLSSQWLILLSLSAYLLHTFFAVKPGLSPANGSFPADLNFIPLALAGVLFGIPLAIATFYWHTRKARKFLRTGLQSTLPRPMEVDPTPARFTKASSNAIAREGLPSPPGPPQEEGEH